MQTNQRKDRNATCWIRRLARKNNKWAYRQRLLSESSLRCKQLVSFNTHYTVIPLRLFAGQLFAYEPALQKIAPPNSFPHQPICLLRKYPLSSRSNRPTTPIKPAYLNIQLVFPLVAVIVNGFSTALNNSNRHSRP